MNDTFLKLTAFLIFIVILVLGMIVGEQLLIPFAWAFLFAFVLHPFSVFLEHKKISRALASIVSTLLFCLISGVVLFYLLYQAVTIIKEEAALYEKVKAGIEEIMNSIQQTFGITLQTFSTDQPSTANVGNVLGWVALQISKIGKNVVTLTLIPMYLFFILNYRGLVKRFVLHQFSGDKLAVAQRFLTDSQRSIKNYLMGTLLLTGVSAIMSFIILLSFGIHYAFFFGVFIAVLNLIPYIGNLIAFVVILLFVWVTKDSGWILSFTGASLYASNIIQENFLRPKLVGDKMEMNAMIVFTAVVLGGMVWGFSGMVLFIPMVGILQALVNSHPDWKGYGIFFEAGDRPRS